jgi:hypothetical protein
VSANDLAEMFPEFYAFYPSEEVFEKLVKRMCQLQERAKLWVGFEEVIGRDGETLHYQAPRPPCFCVIKKKGERIYDTPSKAVEGDK